MSLPIEVTEYNGTVTDCFIATVESRIDGANPAWSGAVSNLYMVHTDTTEQDIWNNADKAVRAFGTFEEASAFLDGVGYTLQLAVSRAITGKTGR